MARSCKAGISVTFGGRRFCGNMEASLLPALVACQVLYAKKCLGAVVAPLRAAQFRNADLGVADANVVARNFLDERLKGLNRFVVGGLFDVHTAFSVRL